MKIQHKHHVVGFIIGAVVGVISTLITGHISDLWLTPAAFTAFGDVVYWYRKNHSLL